MTGEDQGVSRETRNTSSIFFLIHDIHQSVTKSIDTALSWDQLSSPPINYTIVRPLVDRIVHRGQGPSSRQNTTQSSNSDATGDDHDEPTVSGILSVSGMDGGELGTTSSAKGKGKSVNSPGQILFALMTNRLQFLHLAAGDLSSAALQTSRAAFCELLAKGLTDQLQTLTISVKILRATFQDGEEAEYVGELVRAYCSFDGAPSTVIAALDEDEEELEDSRTSALELAIVSKAKRFLSQPLIQHLNNEVYSGTLVYYPHTSSRFINDSYRSPRLSRGTPVRSRNAASSSEHRSTEVYIYDPYEAGWFDHRRLRIPKWRKWLELLEFAILLGLFIATLTFKRLERPNTVELVNLVYTLGFILDEVAALRQHGWEVYMTNAWNAFDITYIAVYCLYLALRVIALWSNSTPTSDLAFDVLAIGACILFPRLMLFLIKDNVVLLALKAMISRFIGFMGFVIVAFSGICFCLWTLGRGTWSVKQITWLMLQIWFGSSYLGFSASESFHPLFGPIVLIGYAALCNTLLITILISILSNQFAEINANAHEEHLFHRVVKTVEGVKSDYVFSYLVPFNVPAFIILWPLSKCCSPRTIHRINVFAIRCTSFPILLAISAYERWSYRSKRIHLLDKVHVQRPSLLETFLGPSSEDTLLSVFDLAPPLPPTNPAPTSNRAGSRDAHDSISTNTKDPAAVFQSPLARLFGPILGGNSIPIATDTQTDTPEVRQELSELRASQLRIEELLAQVLAGTSGAGE